MDRSCPACGRKYRSMADTAQHFESGSYPHCPGADNARRMAYGYARQMEVGSGLRFTTGQNLLTFHGDGSQDLHCRLHCRRRPLLVPSVRQALPRTPQHALAHPIAPAVPGGLRGAAHLPLSGACGSCGCHSRLLFLLACGPRGRSLPLFTGMYMFRSRLDLYLVFLV